MPPRTTPLRLTRILLPAGFLCIVIVLQAVGVEPSPLAQLTLAASLAAVLFYAADKAAARRGSRRVSEATLHLLALLGGWPGAMVAQEVFRHKTVKQPFRIVFWGSVAGNVLLLVAIALASRAPA
jgi:uncharacterized membrane protein YsdA (DUF1294 family)